jgi:hypothetical protein
MPYNITYYGLFVLFTTYLKLQISWWDTKLQQQNLLDPSKFFLKY